ncbi:DnaJ DnaJ-class molecular chaperone with C-terminal Zn finger domain [Pyrenophora tritici-repentis]|uniref:Uncharacterized protein n=1 Tax=Pyrenophora tritici-repentis TaxID=45151 RepID=A0A2W1HQJ1_9PLEO|nr:hypothetical protein PtrM4_110580 [Pyrenophora tritici-repentis]KAI0579143.1 Chaperone protein [Pyrenophora tritici-repentis]KAI1540807.1 DnaJ DnaJ-class molecular chaperone with C-terminal Zn finger domain [Pyrenophora tritici-repentis]KAI1549068.1 DnaJ DnaJ-class molecular chaperone with C-terminal Zn finger domain [Pyrenophora tritici-repentis]KAI1588871.1 DnaJ DnaJ-class molecular chaperone with C-terminal Zn finger domain [Pyrenophora tritici-repentis]
MPHPVYDGGPLDPFADYKAMLNEISGDAEGSRPSTRVVTADRRLSTALKSVCLVVSVPSTALNNVPHARKQSFAIHGVTDTTSTPIPPLHLSLLRLSLANDHYTRSRAHSPPPSPPLQGTKPRNDLYAVLGLSRSATATKIKKAHRAMSLKWHPDRCGEGMKNKATEMMAEINHANDVLGDEKKRAYHDRTGLMASDL